MHTVCQLGARQKVLEVLEILGPRCLKALQIKFWFLRFKFYTVLVSSLRAQFSEVPSTHKSTLTSAETSLLNTLESQILHFPTGIAAELPHYVPFKNS